MKASPKQLAMLRAVARALASVDRGVVYVGGMTTGLLVTDPGAPMARLTDDVDLVIEVASTVDYETTLREALLQRGFREDSREGAPLCRWLLGSVVVDVMPTCARVLGFSNEWYGHALATATATPLPPDAEGEVSIRVITAPAFVATKLAAWKSRGHGDLLHTDLEDIVAVVDGRAELIDEIEAETPELRRFLAHAVAALFGAGFEEQLNGHLPGDGASQARAPIVLTTLRRIARHPNILKIAEPVSTPSGGDPGVTGVPPGSKWDWEILAIERALASRPPHGASHVAVVARLKSHDLTAGTSGDGRNVVVEDGLGRRFKPLYKLLHGERERRQLPGPYDPILPKEPFVTAWVYELPSDAKALRVLLPFEGIELPFTMPQ